MATHAILHGEIGSLKINLGFAGIDLEDEDLFEGGFDIHVHGEELVEAMQSALGEHFYDGQGMDLEEFRTGGDDLSIE
tara:strand:+ start:100 stop:333 length:234 start_codon:yes stop_codon:yes gene_type:complete